MADIEDDDQDSTLSGTYGDGEGGGDDRLTIGQRIAGAKDPATPPPQQTDSAPPSVKVPIDPSMLPDSLSELRPKPLTPSQVPIPPSGTNNQNLIDLAKKQADYGAPIDKDKLGPNGKPMYKLGIGGKILGTLGNFASGLRGGGVVADTSGGATNWKFGRDEAAREANLANTNTQIGTQEKLQSANEKLFADTVKQASDEQVGAAKQQTAAANSQKADVASQLADIKDQATKGQIATAQDKLELLSKHYDQLQKMGQANLDMKQQLAEAQIGLKQAQLENDRAKFTTGTDAKSLEDERKQRIAGIENDYKEHPYIHLLSGDKTQEIKAVNDDINSRLAAVNVNTGGKPAPPAPKVAPKAAPKASAPKGYVRITASDGSLHDIPSGNLAAARQRDPGLKVNQ